MRRTRIIQIALGLALALFVAGSVQALAPQDADAHVPASWKRKAARVAHKYWKAKKPNRVVCRPRQVRIKQTKRKPGGHWAVAGIGACRWAQRTGRKVAFVVWHRAGRLDWGFTCTLIVHEWGHLIGLEHSPQSGRVMSALLPRSIHLRECGKPPKKKASGKARKAGKRVRSKKRR